MRDWLIGLGVATVGVIVSWAVLVLLDAWPVSHGCCCVCSAPDRGRGPAPGQARCRT
ncbi:hypothetical protein ACQP26_15525 [Micromonospora sp. CA-248089]|uniref:hypothetical protein n=1 Tax=Micromonospora sp. CA-248089 TaxID=3239960 RepID=UPI003D90DA23